MTEKLNEEQTQEGMTYNPLTGKIIPVPDKICGTGYIKLVAINSPGPHRQLGSQWEIKARCHNPADPTFQYQLFDVTHKEVETWTKGEQK